MRYCFDSSFSNKDLSYNLSMWALAPSRFSDLKRPPSQRSACPLPSRSHLPSNQSDVFFGGSLLILGSLKVHCQDTFHSCHTSLMERA